MKKHILTLTIGFLAMTGGTLLAQCPASFTWAQTQPNTVDFTNTCSPQNPAWTTYSWNFGDNQSGWGFNAQHTYSTPGTYYACITMQDSVSQTWCTWCDSVTVTGSILCNLYTTVNSANATCQSCADGIAVINPFNGTSPYVYQWSTGATTQAISGLLPGVYTCCVTDANGCSSCDSVYIGVAGPNTCGITFVTNTAPSGWALFQATVTGSNNNPLVTWDYGDMTYGYGMNSWHQFAQSGSYVVCATITDSLSQCTATWCDTVQVTVVPQTCNANFYIFMDSVNTNQAWIYNLSSGGPGVSYQWFWGDNSAVDTVQYPAHVYQNTGAYNICLVIVDQVNQCTDTMCQALWVPRLTQEASLAPFYVNVVPPIFLGVTAASQISDWTLYPNPTNDVLNIKGSTTNDQYVITDLAGRTVMSGVVQNNSVNVSALPGGVFFFTLVKENGQLESKRFIRE